jgi:hypothetical protein
MKHRAITLVILAGLLCSCEQDGTYGGSVPATGTDDVFAEHTRRYERQLDESDAQIEQMWKQMQRYDDLLSKWEEQARRMDMLLERWEKLDTPGVNDRSTAGESSR